MRITKTANSLFQTSCYDEQSVNDGHYYDQELLSRPEPTVSPPLCRLNATKQTFQLVYGMMLCLTDTLEGLFMLAEISTSSLDLRHGLNNIMSPTPNQSIAGSGHTGRLWVQLSTTQLLQVMWKDKNSLPITSGPLMMKTWFRIRLLPIGNKRTTKARLTGGASKPKYRSTTRCSKDHNKSRYDLSDLPFPTSNQNIADPGHMGSL
ncbi:hypothetical protein Tco_0559810 [Tanacetum coccineum]